MRNVVVDKPYAFIPPVRGRFWYSIIQLTLGRRLRQDHGIERVECRGLERLRSSLQAGHGIMLCPNHCRPADPLVMGVLAREAGQPLYTMASWHLFMQSRLLHWLLPRMGVFSVYREGMDRESLKQAMEILKTAERPLVLFPEGRISRANDRLGNLMDGTSFIARGAAKQRAEAGGGRVVVHPVAIRYCFLGDVSSAVSPVLDEIERRLTWEPGTELTLADRITRVGEALLSLKELQVLGGAQEGDLKTRLARLIDGLLDPMEEAWLKGKRTDDVFTRIKRLRTAILPELVTGDLSEAERARRWRQLDDLYLVQQLSCYPPDYVASKPTPERLLETVERFEEDLTDEARIHSPIHAVVEVGEPIEVSPERDRGAAVDPLMQALGTSLDAMLQRLAAQQVPAAPPAAAVLEKKGTPAPAKAAPKTPSWKLRAAVVAVSLVAWFWTQSLLGSRAPLGHGIGDGLHAMTASVNRTLNDHASAANALLISSSACIDLLAVFLLARGIFGPSLRPFLGVLMALGLRQIVQGLCALPPPPQMIWRNPGFPSLLVTYGVSSDFFFSGHTTMAVLGALELGRLRKPWLTGLAITVALFEIATVIVLRAHYTMDVFTGALAALLISGVAARVAPPCDRLLTR
jgi:1-acyl-sn-glycerol-3-phosphate acyltransferase